jgi:maleylacetate reductase
MDSFDCEFLPGRVVFGSGSLRCIGDETSALSLARVILVAGGSAKPAADRAAELLGDAVATRFGTVIQHVPEGLAEEGRAAADDADADGVVAVGGGSATGLGKVVAVARGIPLIAVPTTYSGSEMTPVYGTTGERKVTIRDLRALPRVAIYDPDLTSDLSPRVSAASGFNAMAHCVEAIVGPGATPPTALLAAEALGIMPRALRGCVARPSDPEARSDGLYGAMLAGRALASAGTGLQHRLAHVLGGRFNAIHADAHAALLPYVTAYHERERPAATARVAHALGVEGSAAAALHALAADVGAPTSLAAIGITPEQVDLVAAEGVPGIDEGDLRALLDDAMQGRSPKNDQRHDDIGGAMAAGG